MGLNTYPANPFPPSTDQMDADTLEAEVSKLKSDVSSLESGLTNYEATTNAALALPEGTGKNLLAIPDGEGTFADVTYTINNTAIQVVGTADGNSYYTIYSWNQLKDTFLASYAGQKVKISSTSDNVRFTLAYRKDGSSAASENNVYNGETELTLPSDTTYQIYLAFRVLSGVSINTVIYPMIRLANITDSTFAPYIPSVESRIEAVESGLTNLNNRTYYTTTWVDFSYYNAGQLSGTYTVPTLPTGWSYRIVSVSNIFPNSELGVKLSGKYLHNTTNREIRAVGTSFESTDTISILVLFEIYKL